MSPSSSIEEISETDNNDIFYDAIPGVSVGTSSTSSSSSNLIATNNYNNNNNNNNNNINTNNNNINTFTAVSTNHTNTTSAKVNSSTETMLDPSETSNGDFGDFVDAMDDNDIFVTTNMNVNDGTMNSQQESLTVPEFPSAEWNDTPMINTAPDTSTIPKSKELLPTAFETIGSSVPATESSAMTLPSTVLLSSSSTKLENTAPMNMKIDDETNRGITCEQPSSFEPYISNAVSTITGASSISTNIAISSESNEDDPFGHLSPESAPLTQQLPPLPPIELSNNPLTASHAMDYDPFGVFESNTIQSIPTSSNATTTHTGNSLVAHAETETATTVLQTPVFESDLNGRNFSQQNHPIDQPQTMDCFDDFGAFVEVSAPSTDEQVDMTLLPNPYVPDSMDSKITSPTTIHEEKLQNETKFQPNCTFDTFTTSESTDFDVGTPTYHSNPNCVVNSEDMDNFSADPNLVLLSPAMESQQSLHPTRPSGLEQNGNKVNMDVDTIEKANSVNGESLRSNLEENPSIQNLSTTLEPIANSIVSSIDGADITVVGESHITITDGSADAVGDTVNDDDFGDFGDFETAEVPSPNEEPISNSATTTCEEAYANSNNVGEDSNISSSCRHADNVHKVDEDDFEDFDDFNSAFPTEPIDSGVTEMIVQANFNDLNTTPKMNTAATDVTPTEANTNHVQDVIDDDDDDFGDFDEAPATTVSLEENLSPPPNDDFPPINSNNFEADDDFGDFSSLQETTSTATQQPTIFTNDPILQHIQRGFSNLFTRSNENDDVVLEDNDTTNESRATTDVVTIQFVLSNLDSCDNEASKNNNLSPETVATLLEEVSTTSEISTYPCVLRNERRGPFTHTWYPVGGFLASVTASGHQHEIPEHQKSIMHLPDVLSIQLPTTETTDKKLASTSSRTSVETEATKNVTTFDNSRKTPKKSTLEAAVSNGSYDHSTADNVRQFLSKIPDLSFMLSSKLSLPTQK